MTQLNEERFVNLKYKIKIKKKKKGKNCQNKIFDFKRQ